MRAGANNGRVNNFYARKKGGGGAHKFSGVSGQEGEGQQKCASLKERVRRI